MSFWNDPLPQPYRRVARLVDDIVEGVFDEIHLQQTVVNKLSEAAQNAVSVHPTLTTAVTSIQTIQSLNMDGADGCPRVLSLLSDGSLTVFDPHNRTSTHAVDFEEEIVHLSMRQWHRRSANTYVVLITKSCKLILGRLRDSEEEDDEEYAVNPLYTSKVPSQTSLNSRSFSNLSADGGRYSIVPIGDPVELAGADAKLRRSMCTSISPDFTFLLCAYRCSDSTASKPKRSTTPNAEDGSGSAMRFLVYRLQPLTAFLERVQLYEQFDEHLNDPSESQSKRSQSRPGLSRGRSAASSASLGTSKVEKGPPTLQPFALGDPDEGSEVVVDRTHTLPKNSVDMASTPATPHSSPDDSDPQPDSAADLCDLCQFSWVQRLQAPESRGPLDPSLLPRPFRHITTAILLALRGAKVLSVNGLVANGSLVKAASTNAGGNGGESAGNAPRRYWSKDLHLIGRVSVVCGNSNGSLVACGLDSGLVTVVNVALSGTAHCISPYVHRRGVSALCFLSPTLLVSGARDGSLSAVDVSSPHCPTIVGVNEDVRDPHSPITSLIGIVEGSIILAVSPQQFRLLDASSSDSGLIHLANLIPSAARAWRLESSPVLCVDGFYVTCSERRVEAPGVGGATGGVGVRTCVFTVRRAMASVYPELMEALEQHGDVSDTSGGWISTLRSLSHLQRLSTDSINDAAVPKSMRTLQQTPQLTTLSRSLSRSHSHASSTAFSAAVSTAAEPYALLQVSGDALDPGNKFRAWHERRDRSKAARERRVWRFWGRVSGSGESGVPEPLRVSMLGKPQVKPVER